jgi:hypothetical protein
MRLLRLAGFLSACLAFLHLVIVFVGAPAYRYFGAGERMARLAEERSLIPGAITLALTLVLVAWSGYAFSGAGVLRRPPFLRTGLIGIGVVYTLRGLLLGPQMVWFLSGYRDAVPVRQLVFSAVALLIGLAYLIGTKDAWAGLGGPR